jgi:molecular chaperone GrpE
VAPDLNSIDDLESAADQGSNREAGVMSAETGTGTSDAAPPSAEPAATEATAPVSVPPADAAEAVPPEPGAPGAAVPDGALVGEALLAAVALSVREIADATDRYHARAEQREGVIDHLRSELELLRQGERRGLLRPVLADMCRLRDDLLKQAATLPGDFDAAKAAELLRSYAETIELTLESNGVVTYSPDSGDPFNPRMHRRVSGEPTIDPALAGHIAAIRRDGYLDIEANSPIAAADVTVFVVTKGEQEQ